jgi:hypothetical protein
MTVTIASMCDVNYASQTCNFIMNADTLISHLKGEMPVTSNPNGSKIYELPCGFYVAIADDISRSHQVVSYLHKRMEGITPGHPKTYDKVKEALEKTEKYVRLWMRDEVLADWQVSEDEFLHDKKLVSRKEIAAEIKNRVIATQLIIAGFGHNNSPVLLFTDCTHIEEQTSPGFFCGGSGAWAATDWLNFREQNCGMSTQRTFYHVREAQRFATVCPTVGESSKTILLRPGKPMVNLTKETALLSQWMSDMYPRSTDALADEKAWSDFAAAYDIPD